MADEPDDELLLIDEVDEQRDEPADDITIEIEGDDEPEETPLIKQLRQNALDANRRAAEAERKLKPQQSPPEPGKKPDLWEDCEGDPERFEREYDAWKERTQAVKDFGRKQEEAAQARNHQFERIVANYRSRAAQLGVPDFGEVEARMMQKVPELLRNAVLQYADDPAKVMLALDKYPGKLDALLAVGDPDMGGDPIKFILGIKDVERTMKVVNRRKPPEPEADTIQRGSAPMSAQSTDKKLAALEAKAARTGDRTEVLAYKRAIKR